MFEIKSTQPNNLNNKAQKVALYYDLMVSDFDE